MAQRFARLLTNAFTTLFCLAVLASVHPVFAQSQKITVLTEEWAPYNYSENGEVKGFSVEVVRHIAQDLNENVEFVVLPSMRATKTLRRTPGAMFVSLFRTPAREDQYHWIGPLIDSAIYFYKRTNNPLQISTLQDAKNVDVVAIREAGLVPKILKAEGFTNLDDTAKDGWGVYQKLLADRSDLGISDSPLGVKYILEKLGYPVSALTQTPVKVLDMQLYIAVNIDTPYYRVVRWQRALERLKASETYDQLVKKYSE